MTASGSGMATLVSISLDAAARCGRVHAEVLARHFGELLADDDRRVEGAQRALIDDADLRAPQRPELPVRQAEQLDAVETHAAVRDAAVLRQVADGAHGERGLAGAGLAHEPEALVLVDGERDVADRVQDAELGGVVDAEALDLEDGAGGGGHQFLPPPGSMTCRSPSDMRLVAMTRTAMVMAGKRRTHGAMAKKARAWLICSPQSGEGGWTPSPRNPSEATRKIE